MRSHQSMLLGLAVSMLMVLPGSARDAVNSDSPIFLSQAGGDQPASGHVEAQGSGEKELHFPPLPPEWLPPWPMRPLPGLYAFRTYYGYNLSAVGGGGRTVDAIHTDVQMIGPWEKFRLWCCDPDNPQYFAIQTIGGRFLTATAAGGLRTPFVPTRRTSKPGRCLGFCTPLGTLSRLTMGNISPLSEAEIEPATPSGPTQRR
jgi:hypothetical protein